MSQHDEHVTTFIIWRYRF